MQLTQFGVGLDLVADGNVNFVVFEDATLIYQSGSVASIDIGYHEALSPALSLTLVPGNNYFIGVTTDVGTEIGCCGTGGTQGVVTSIAANSNPSGFLNPTRGATHGAHIDINLYSGNVITPSTDPTVEQIQTEISNLMQERARHLIAAQPDLIGFLSGSATGAFNVNATSGNGTFELATSGGRPIWARVRGDWSENGDIANSYFFGVAGAHYAVNPDLLIGGMLQFDTIKQENGENTTQGDGYLVGPYIVAKLPDHPLYFEGRYLVGRTENTVTIGDADAQAFDTDRTLASLKVAGQLEYDDLTFTPSLTATHLEDTQGAFTDNADQDIPEQSITVQNVALGLDVAKAFVLENGALTLTGGIAGSWSKTEGTGFAETLTPNFEGKRASVHLGSTFAMHNGMIFSAQANYDGIGTDDFESFGLELGFEMVF
ncbi:hypothetical protein SAMN04488005_2359 [Yoonia tamlensis]|uniref:Autotransporter domain-containing protein n=1 Tax=Yoonia tamlensis TaxID=390270 RepID=A0A1I6GYQ2_9RHOB|nr:autotransporter outer membrane beta-barrel domain-containing protein [Yoonia tamlensis]SFR47362.1 hypothetical protein SAMN04488005_2359 [Yoonia tamlensis]